MEAPLHAVEILRLGPVVVTDAVVVTWGIMIALLAVAFTIRRAHSLAGERGRMVLELTIETLDAQIRQIMHVADARPFLPLLGTVFLFILCANLSSLIPGIEAPTGRVETAIALAGIVFFAVHYHGIRRRGLAGYLRSFAQPTLIMLPLNLLAQFTRALSLAVRLFGNVLSGGFVVGIAVALAGLFVPIPFMALELLVGIIQAYIFTVLAAVFIGGAIGTTDT